MKIAMVSEHASPLARLGGADAGGQNVHVAALAAGLAARGHEVRVFTRRDDPDLPPRVDVDGYVVEHLDAGPARAVPKDQLLPLVPEMAAELVRRCAQDPPALVHAHFWMSGLASVRAARLLNVPVVQTFHALGVVKRRHQGVDDTSPQSRVDCERQLCRQLDLVVATCSDEVFELRRMGLPNRRAAVVPCGVDRHRFQPAPVSRVRRRGSRTRFLAVSRLVPRKGLDDAIRALVHAPNAELVVVGGPAHQHLLGDAEAVRLSRLAADHGVASRVELRGSVDHDDVPDLMRSCDALVTVPWYEPFGMVAVEAMACGLPVVATAVGGMRDTVVDGLNGILVPPRRFDLVGAAMRRLCDDPATRTGMGRAGAERASRYGWPRIAHDTERAYSRVLRQPALAFEAEGS